MKDNRNHIAEMTVANEIIRVGSEIFYGGRKCKVAAVYKGHDGFDMIDVKIDDRIFMSQVVPGLDPRYGGVVRKILPPVNKKHAHSAQRAK